MGGLFLGVTVAMKRELDISFRTEIGHTWAYHVLVPGAKRVIGSAKVEALQDERLITDYKQAMEKKYIKTLKRLEKFGELKEKITQAKLKAAEMEQNTNDMRQNIREDQHEVLELEKHHLRRSQIRCRRVGRHLRRRDGAGRFVCEARRGRRDVRGRRNHRSERNQPDLLREDDVQR